jgi:hypothetical protein
MAPAGSDEIGRLAASIADALSGSPQGPVEGNPQAVARVVEVAIRTNFRVEEQILQEADRTLAELGASATGMDRGKLLAGIRERIAKKRGFVL